VIGDQGVRNKQYGRFADVSGPSFSKGGWNNENLAIGYWLFAIRVALAIGYQF
jgi:hypothetical protein